MAEPTAPVHDAHLTQTRRAGPARIRSAVLCILATLLAWAACAACPTAHATVPGQDAVTLVWDTANRVYYGNYNTPIFTTVAGDGSVAFAYCVDPTTAVPDAGGYATLPLDGFGAASPDEMRAALWFGYGGPGFDPSMWPSAWADGSPMNDVAYYAATHLILSYAATHSSGYAYYNAGSDFIAYAASSFMGIDLAKNVVNPNATMFQMFARAAEVPDDYVCYGLACGEWDYTQHIVAQDAYNPPTVPTAAEPLVVVKEDRQTGGSPQGGATLAGARFQIDFYDGTYTLENLPERPTYSWTVATDEQGRAFLSDGYLVGGDDPVRDADGRVAVPLGTLVVYETAAPDGYALGSPNRQLLSVELGGDGSPTVIGVSAVADDVLRGGLSVRKSDLETASGTPQGSATLEGALFGIANANERPVVVDGTSYGPGETVAVISTDASGCAQTAPDALPYGMYRVQETQPPTGYLPNEESWCVQIDGPGIVPVGSATPNRLVGDEKNAVDKATVIAIAAEESPVVAEQVVRGGIAVQKVDVDSGLAEPQGGASLAGAVFAIANASDRPVVVDGALYQTGEIVATVVTDDTGRAQTAPDTLPFGTYTVTEVQAPASYLPSAESRTVEIREEGVVVTAEPFGEQVARGGVSIAKVDADLAVGSPQGSATLAGAMFCITNASEHPVIVEGTAYEPGKTVATLVTDENGRASTGEQTLPFGTYRVQETQAPVGYLLNETVWEVVIEHEGTLVTVGEPPGMASFEIAPQEAEPGESDPSDVAPEAVDEQTDAESGFPNPFAMLAALFAPSTAIAQETQEPREAEPEASVAQEGAAQESSETEAATIPEQVVRGGVEVRKVDGETDAGVPQGSATLEGTVFDIVSLNKNPVLVDSTLYGLGDTVLSIATDSEGVATSASDALPYGLYEVFEASPPAGYLPADAAIVQRFFIEENGTVVALDQPFANDPVRGGLSVQKVDADGGQAIARAGASLWGARFEVVNASAGSVTVDGVSYAPGETVAILVTDASGFTQTGERDLPFGTYTVREIAAPEGYVADCQAEQAVQVAEDGTVVACAAPFPNRVVRGDVQGLKVEDGTGGPMPGVAFLVTSLATGERHVVVADETGTFSTASSAAPHTQGTNANDAALNGAGEVVDETLLSSANGVWFSGSNNTPTEPDDLLGALPFDTYRFDELATSASYGHTLVSFEVSIREDGATVDLKEVSNRMIKLKTEARIESTGTDEGPSDGTDRVFDTVFYSGLEPGAVYEIHGELLDRSTGEPLLDNAGSPITAQGAFVPESTEGEVEVVFNLDTSLLAGTRVVVVERLVREGVELASHTDRSDDGQTVSFVEIQTSAAGWTSQTNEEQATDDTVIIDTVSYQGLTPGRSYRLSARLVNQATGEPFVDAWGEVPTGEVDFTPSSPNGSIEVEISFDASGMAGTSVVVFEELTRDDVVVASHADLGDAAQTVSLVDIKTSARDGDTTTHTGIAGPDAYIVDTISYQGLKPGESYMAEGVLVDLATLAPLEDETGSAIRASTTFTPNAPDGSIEVVFFLDASDLQGHTLVVLENLLHDGIVVASHADLDDAEQMVSWYSPHIPKLGQTGRGTAPLAMAIGGIAATVAGLTALLAARRARKARRGSLQTTR